MQGCTHLLQSQLVGRRLGSGLRRGGSGGVALGKTDQCCHGFLGIAQHQQYVICFIQGIGNTGVTGLGIEVAENSLGGFLHIQHRHAIDRSIGCAVGRRVRHIVCTNYDGDIAGFKVRINIFHHIELIVIDVCLAQQHAHVTGHTTCHWVDGEFDFCAPLFQSGGQLGYIGLSLRKRHAITGNNDDLLSILQGCAHLL